MKTLHQKSSQVGAKHKQDLIAQAEWADQQSKALLNQTSESWTWADPGSDAVLPIEDALKLSHSDAQIKPSTVSFRGSDELIQVFMENLCGAGAPNPSNALGDTHENPSAQRWAVMVACSPHRPGGGWRSGAVAQEETVSRHSTWGYQAEHDQTSWHTAKGAVQGPQGALVMQGYWLGSPKNPLSPPKPVLFLGMAAANRAEESPQSWQAQRTTAMQKLYEDAVAGFQAAQQQGATHVAACALGTGVFGWSIEDSVSVLKAAMQTVPSLEYVWVAGCLENMQSIEQAWFSGPVFNPSSGPMVHPRKAHFQFKSKQ